MKRLVRYAVKTRYGEVETTNKKDALRLYMAERQDGWPSSIRCLATGQRIK